MLLAVIIICINLAIILFAIWLLQSYCLVCRQLTWRTEHLFRVHRDIMVQVYWSRATKHISTDLIGEAIQFACMFWRTNLELVLDHCDPPVPSIDEDFDIATGLYDMSIVFHDRDHIIVPTNHGTHFKAIGIAWIDNKLIFTAAIPETYQPFKKKEAIKDRVYSNLVHEISHLLLAGLGVPTDAHHKLYEKVKLREKAQFY